MAEEEEFERQDYGKTDEGQSTSSYTEAQNNLLVAPQCSTDSCTCSTEEPAEAAWVKLMSAVPQASQINNLRAAREGTMMLPEGQTIQSMVSSIRPQPEADYALDTIRDEWTDFHEQFRVIGPKLEQGLADLSKLWKGDDFDAFEEQSETVIKNCRTLLDDIGGEDGTDGIVKVLDDKQLEIFEQQGGTACVYPAPKFYMEGTSCGSHRIHIRPPFYKNCVIEENDEIKHAVELAGFDPTVVDEVQEGRQAEYDRWLEYATANPDYEVDGLKGEELAQKKADEYADRELVAMGAKGSEQLEEQAAIVNEEVTERHSNVEAQVTEIEPDSKPSETTTFNDGQTDIPDNGGLDIGDGGTGMPDLGGGGGGGGGGGLDDMAPPTDLNSLNNSNSDGLGGTGGQGGNLPSDYTGGSNDLNGLGDENPFGPGEDPDGTAPDGDIGNVGNVGNTGGLPPTDYSSPNGLDGLDDSPWSPSESDPDDLDGGLASGGNGPSSPSLTAPGAPPSSPGGPNLTTTGVPYRPNGGTTGRTPSPATGRGLGSGRGISSTSNGGRGISSTSNGKGLGSGSGSGGRGISSTSGGSGLRGGAGAGAGMGAGAGSAAAGKAGSVSGGGMVPGAAGGGKGPGDDPESDREVFLTEDDDIWGGMPEDEDEDPFA
ncbi:hypothetical protein [Glycomyces buryatensis]|uniref:Uncharacterized protein n=1 Tax=Glycomyces buryatensis TaxID=2570927 RepID=A0A4S8QDV7_9ACTN|nr:hypothetical protein [Glycomyces buryatensis]THV42578.1 hypothetical protein FAB82_05240 [Glycomyces buryatensis]